MPLLENSQPAILKRNSDEKFEQANGAIKSSPLEQLRFPESLFFCPSASRAITVSNSTHPLSLPSFPISLSAVGGDVPQDTYIHNFANVDNHMSER